MVFLERVSCAPKCKTAGGMFAECPFAHTPTLMDLGQSPVWTGLLFSWLFRLLFTIFSGKKLGGLPRVSVRSESLHKHEELAGSTLHHVVVTLWAVGGSWLAAGHWNWAWHGIELKAGHWDWVWYGIELKAGHWDWAWYGIVLGAWYWVLLVLGLWLGEGLAQGMGLLGRFSVRMD